MTQERQKTSEEKKANESDTSPPRNPQPVEQHPGGAADMEVGL